MNTVQDKNVLITVTFSFDQYQEAVLQCLLQSQRETLLHGNFTYYTITTVVL